MTGFLSHRKMLLIEFFEIVKSIKLIRDGIPPPSLSKYEHDTHKRHIEEIKLHKPLKPHPSCCSKFLHQMFSQQQLEH